MIERDNVTFDLTIFLAKAGPERRIVRFKLRGVLSTQGSPADLAFCHRKGSAKLAFVSKTGKEATISLRSAREFVGEGLIAGAAGLRVARATAITTCVALEIERDEIIRVMCDEHTFSDLFIKFLLTRNMRAQADLVDQLIESSEKCLARILLLMPKFGQQGRSKMPILHITLETLAEMIGSTLFRVNVFINRKLGLIQYNGRIRVHRALLNVFLHDRSFAKNAISALQLIATEGQTRFVGRRWLA